MLDVTIYFQDERVGTNLVLAAELEELRVETADAQWQGKFFGKEITADEFSCCNLCAPVCSLLCCCCGPRQREFKLVSLSNLRVWWAQSLSLEFSGHKWGSEPQFGCFWILRPFSCHAKVPHQHPPRSPASSLTREIASDDFQPEQERCSGRSVLGIVRSAARYLRASL